MRIYNQRATLLFRYYPYITNNGRTRAVRIITLSRKQALDATTHMLISIIRAPRNELIATAKGNSRRITSTGNYYKNPKPKPSRARETLILH